MKNFFVAIIAISFFACNPDNAIEYDSDGKVNKLNFSIKEKTDLYYTSKSLFYLENSDKVRFKDSAMLTYKLISTDKNILKWILSPGSISKEIPDTMFYENLPRGIFSRYNKELYEGADKNKLILPLPLLKGQTWSTNFFTYQATGQCINTDTIIKTKVGEFQCIEILYSFNPDYMNDFVKDTTNFEIKAKVSDFISSKGNVLSRIDYFVVEKINPKNRWRILSNETILDKVLEN